MAVRSSAIPAYSAAVRAGDVSRLARPTTSSYSASTSAATRSQEYLPGREGLPRPAHALRGVGVVQQPADRARHVGRVERRDQPGPGLGDLPVHAHLVGYDDGRAGRHSLHDRDREVLVAGRQHEDVRRPQQLPLVLPDDHACEYGPLGDAALVDEVPDLRLIPRRAAARDYQREVVPALGQRFGGLRKHVEALYAVEPRQEEDDLPTLDARVFSLHGDAVADPGRRGWVGAERNEAPI